MEITEKRRQDEKENHDDCAKYGNTSDSSFVHKLWKMSQTYKRNNDSCENRENYERNKKERED